MPDRTPEALETLEPDRADIRVPAERLIFRQTAYDVEEVLERRHGVYSDHVTDFEQEEADRYYLGLDR